MTVAGVTHCVLGVGPASGGNVGPQSFISTVFAFWDVWFTSSIGLLFFFDALVDTGLIKDTNPCTFAVFGAGMAGIWYGWYLCIFKGWTMGFWYMYIGCVGLGCGSWVFIQFFLIIWQANWKGLKYLLLAGFSGAVGFYPIAEPGVEVWMCKLFGCHGNILLVWFAVTDLCIYLIYQYFQTRASLKSEESIALLRQQQVQPFFVEMNRPQQYQGQQGYGQQGLGQFLPVQQPMYYAHDSRYAYQY